MNTSEVHRRGCLSFYSNTTWADCLVTYFPNGFNLGCTEEASALATGTGKGKATAAVTHYLGIPSSYLHTYMYNVQCGQPSVKVIQREAPDNESYTNNEAHMRVHSVENHIPHILFYTQTEAPDNESYTNNEAHMHVRTQCRKSHTSYTFLYTNRATCTACR